ncbi:MAG: hypothetical protein WCI73_15730 [Phycisphaerae bacterium]
MVTIANPIPVTPAAMTRMWVSSMRLFPNLGGLGLEYDLCPYDGSNLLATGRRHCFFDSVDTDPAWTTWLAAIVAEVQRQAATTSAVREIRIAALDPSLPVRATITFADGSTYVIENCFLLASTDPTFAQVFGTAMATLATRAGFTVTA